MYFINAEPCKHIMSKNGHKKKKLKKTQLTENMQYEKMLIQPLDFQPSHLKRHARVFWFAEACIQIHS